MDSDDTVMILVFLLIVSIVFLGGRLVFVEDNNFELFCEEKFGEGFYYEPVNSCNDYRECARECRNAIINHSSRDVSIISKYFVYSQFESVCDRPKYWNFKDWSWECQVEKGFSRFRETNIRKENISQSGEEDYIGCELDIRDPLKRDVCIGWAKWQYNNGTGRPYTQFGDSGKLEESK